MESRMNPTESWGALVGEMLRRRIALEQAAPALYPMAPFGLRGTDADIAAAEERLGHPLDAQHAAVLREVDGWPDAFAHGDLLGTGDLGAGARWDDAMATLSIYDEDGPISGWPPRSAIYPIHLGGISMFVIDLSGPVTDGGHPVYWLSNDLLDRWPNVREYWSAGFTILAQTERLAEERAHEQNGL
jgi:hypothetical protein